MSILLIVAAMLWLMLQRDEPRRVNKKKLYEQRIINAKKIMEEHYGS